MTSEMASISARVIFQAKCAPQPTLKLAWVSAVTQRFLPSQQILWRFMAFVTLSCESHNMTPSSQIWTNVKATWRTTVRTPAATPWSATRVSAPKVSRSVHTHLSNVDVGGGTSVTVLMVRLTCLHSCINFTDRYLSQCSSYAVWQLLAKKWNIDVKHKTSKQTKKQPCQRRFSWMCSHTHWMCQWYRCMYMSGYPAYRRR